MCAPVICRKVALDARPEVRTLHTELLPRWFRPIFRVIALSQQGLTSITTSAKGS
jgi:hypothetical protein